MCVREQGTGRVQITPRHSAWFESLGVLLPESGFEMVLCGRHCLTFGEKYLENQWVLGNQLLWAWLIYRCNLRSWFSFWSRDAYLLSLSTWGLSAWWTFFYSFCCVGAKVVDLLWANILLCPEEDWHVIRFQWSINRDLFFVTQVFSLSLSLVLNNYPLEWSRLFSPCPRACGSQLQARVWGESVLIFRVLAAGPSALVKWTHVEHLTKGRERETEKTWGRECLF